jgi:hypothetical protein
MNKVLFIYKKVVVLQPQQTRCSLIHWQAKQSNLETKVSKKKI